MTQQNVMNFSQSDLRRLFNVGKAKQENEFGSQIKAARKKSIILLGAFCCESHAKQYSCVRQGVSLCDPSNKSFDWFCGIVMKLGT